MTVNRVLLSSVRTRSLLRVFRSPLLAVLVFFQVTLLHEDADADPPDVREEMSGPQVCIGYDYPSKKWGHYHHYSSPHLCPPHHAIIGVQKPSVSNPSHARLPIDANCCPLPANDILTEHSVYVDFECPEDYVATGDDGRKEGREGIKRLRCTKINTEKYILGPPQAGIHWGINVSAAFPWREKRFIRWDQLPLAIRYGISRITKTHFNGGGCVGAIVGSLLTAKKHTSCKGFFWRELRYRESVPASDSGRAVKMFPQCEKIDDVFSPNALCIRQTETKTDLR